MSFELLKILNKARKNNTPFQVSSIACDSMMINAQAEENGKSIYDLAINSFNNEYMRIKEFFWLILHIIPHV